MFYDYRLSYMVIYSQGFYKYISTGNDNMFTIAKICVCHLCTKMTTIIFFFTANNFSHLQTTVPKTMHTTTIRNNKDHVKHLNFTKTVLLTAAMCVLLSIPVHLIKFKQVAWNYYKLQISINNINKKKDNLFIFQAVSIKMHQKFWKLSK